MTLIPEKIRRPISFKIFGITLILLILMTLVTFSSTINLKNVNGQLEILSDYYIPLDQAVSEVRTHNVQQVLNFERLLVQLKSPQTLDAIRQEFAKTYAPALGDCGFDKTSEVGAQLRKAFPDESERLIASYEVQRHCGDIKIQAASALVAKALTLPSVTSDTDQIKKFSVLQSELKRIPDSRANLNATITKYLIENQRADKPTLSLLKEQVEQHRRAFNRDTRSVTKLLHQYTRESANRVHAMEAQAFKFNWGVTLIAVFVGLIFAWFLTRNMVRPLRELLTGAKAIEQGNFDHLVPVTSSDEIALLTKSFNFMATGLKEKESIKETFGKYVDPRIVKAILEKSPFSQAGEKRLMTVFFSDIEGFTPLCEQLTPDGVVKLLNKYFSAMSAPIQNNHGAIDKFIGDAIMAFWGPPFTDEQEHAKLACFAALEQHEALKNFRLALPDITGLRKGLPNFNVRMGIATGDVTVGSVGSDSAKSYTVIGDTVNLSSRLEAANKQFGTNLIISHDTWKMARDHVEARELDCIRVVGKSEPVKVFELLGRQGQVPADVLRLRDTFEQGLAFYRERDWVKAAQCFQDCLALNPGDSPSQLFIARLQFFENHSPVEGWDGVWNFTEK